MIDYKTEFILLIIENKQFTLKAGDQKKVITIPSDYLEVLDWENQKVEITNAWWTKHNKCFRIQIELSEIPKDARGKWAK